MKKTYEQPSVMMGEMVSLAFICSSQDIVSGDGNITYGGVDENGEKEPSSRRYIYDVWEDE